MVLALTNNSREVQERISNFVYARSVTSEFLQNTRTNDSGVRQLYESFTCSNSEQGQCCTKLDTAQDEYLAIVYIYIYENVVERISYM